MVFLPFDPRSFYHVPGCDSAASSGNYLHTNVFQHAVAIALYKNIDWQVKRKRKEIVQNHLY